jgi:hypothetical protein
MKGMAWSRLEMWKLNKCRRGTRKDQCPICGGAEVGMNITLRSIETSNWGVEAICE